MRRALANSFSEKILRGQETVIESFMDIAITNIRTLASSKGADLSGCVLNILQWLDFFSMDVIGDLALGESFDNLRNGRYHEWVVKLHPEPFVKEAALIIAARYYLPLDFGPFEILTKSLRESLQKRSDFTNERINKRLSSGVERPDFVSALMKTNQDFQNLSLEEVHANLALFMAAGTETTATTLGALFSYLTRNPGVLQKLKTEIRTTFKNEGDVTIAAIRELPYLNATISEALRLVPASPSIMNRIVGAGGDTICDAFIPEG